MKVKRVGSSQSTAPATNRIPWVCASCLRSERFIVWFGLHGVGKPPGAVLSLGHTGGVPIIFGFDGRFGLSPSLIVLEEYAPELHGGPLFPREAGFSFQRCIRDTVFQRVDVRFAPLPISHVL